MAGVERCEPRAWQHWGSRCGSTPATPSKPHFRRRLACKGIRLRALLGHGFDFAHRLQLRDDVANHPLSFVNVGDLAATEDDRHDHLVFVFQEPAGLLDLEFDVVIARLGADARFFDLAVMDVSLVLFFFCWYLNLP